MSGRRTQRAGYSAYAAAKGTGARASSSALTLTSSPPPPAVVVGVVRDEQIGIKRIKETRARHPDAPPPALVVAVVFVVVVRALLLQPEALRHDPNRSNRSVIHALEKEIKMHDIRLAPETPILN
jgi:hypothetical protein